MQQLLGSVFALREFRPLQREVINATLQARPPHAVAFRPWACLGGRWRAQGLTAAKAACIAAD